MRSRNNDTSDKSARNSFQRGPASMQRVQCTHLLSSNGPLAGSPQRPAGSTRSNGGTLPSSILMLSEALTRQQSNADSTRSWRRPTLQCGRNWCIGHLHLLFHRRHGHHHHSQEGGEKTPRPPDAAQRARNEAATDPQPGAATMARKEAKTHPQKKHIRTRTATRRSSSARGRTSAARSSATPARTATAITSTASPRARSTTSTSTSTCPTAPRSTAAPEGKKEGRPLHPEDEVSKNEGSATATETTPPETRGVPRTCSTTCEEGSCRQPAIISCAGPCQGAYCEGHVGACLRCRRGPFCSMCVSEVNHTCEPPRPPTRAFQAAEKQNPRMKDPFGALHEHAQEAREKQSPEIGCPGRGGCMEVCMCCGGRRCHWKEHTRPGHRCRPCWTQDCQCRQEDCPEGLPSEQTEGHRPPLHDTGSALPRIGDDEDTEPSLRAMENKQAAKIQRCIWCKEELHIGSIWCECPECGAALHRTASGHTGKTNTKCSNRHPSSGKTKTNPSTTSPSQWRKGETDAHDERRHLHARTETNGSEKNANTPGERGPQERKKDALRNRRNQTANHNRRRRRRESADRDRASRKLSRLRRRGAPDDPTSP